MQLCIFESRSFGNISPTQKFGKLSSLSLNRQINHLKINENFSSILENKKGNIDVNMLSIEFWMHALVRLPFNQSASYILPN